MISLDGFRRFITDDYGTQRVVDGITLTACGSGPMIQFSELYGPMEQEHEVRNRLYKRYIYARNLDHITTD
jgi:hypothetical protein